MNQSNDITELCKALAAAQKELRNPSFDSTNPHFKSKFVSLASLRNETLPVMLKHGLSVTQSLGGDGSTVSCTTHLLHISGQWKDYGPFSVPVAKGDAQTACAASTYTRRYSWQAAIGVVGDEDDDGNAASGRPSGKANEDFPPTSGPIGKPVETKPAASDPIDPRIHLLLTAAKDKIGREPLKAWLMKNYPAFDAKKGGTCGLSEEGATELCGKLRELTEAKK